MNLINSSKLTLLTFLACITFSVILLLASPVKSADNLTITAQVPYNTSILIDPEKRVPPVGNDSLEVEVEFRNVGSTTALYSETVTTDNSGYAELLPLNPDVIPEGNYDIAIKGLSHLRRNFENVTLTPALDLTYEQLLAGDSHPSSDNFINSMDINYEILNIYSSDLRADLNRDTTINSLDIAILTSNLYEFGDE